MKNVKTLCFVLLAMFLSTTIFAQLTVTATTSSNNKRYSPRNCIAIWIQDKNGNFVKNIQLRSASRTQHLYTWVSRYGWTFSDGYSGIDGWTGATRNSHGTISGVWDLTDRNGNDVSFGDYTFWVEYTEEHAQGPLASGTISIGAESRTITVQSSYINITADYKPKVVITPTPEPVLMGDVNSDGLVNIVDALLIAQYYIQVPVQIDLVAADVNCSNTIDIVDSLLIAQLYVRLITSLPCSQ